MRGLYIFIAAMLLGGTMGVRQFPVAAQCAAGRNPVTEMGLRFQLGETFITATVNNPYTLPAGSDDTSIRYLRARLTADTLGTGSWYVTVRDLLAHPLVTFSRADFQKSNDRWTARIPGSVATMDLFVADGATSPRIRVTEYIAMPERAEHPYYSVKTAGDEDFRDLYTSHSETDRKFRSWGDAVGFVMASSARQLWGCSGVLVGPRLFMTAWHCGGNRVEDSAYWNADICRDLLIDLSWDDDGASRDYGCVKVVDKNKALDFALLAIEPIASIGDPRPAVMSLTPLPSGAPLILIHHPVYMRKQLTTRCGVDRWAHPGWVAEAGDVDLSHDCDSEGGSSGAPIFNDQGRLVALHHHGHDIDSQTCSEIDRVNKAVRIEEIMRYLQRNKSRNANVVTKLVPAK